MVSSHKIAISGANGFVAKNLRKFLSIRNIPVVCFSRKNFKSYKNEIKVITPTYSERTLLPKLKNCTTFIHLVGVGRQKFDSDYILTNLELTKKILNACKKSNIKKFVFNSGLGTTSNSTTDYFISKYRAEQEIINSKLTYTIFRPSYIVGKDDYLTKSLKEQIKQGKIILPGSGNFLMQPIHINDVCEIIYQSIISEKYCNKIIDLVGPETISYKKFISQMKFKKIDKISLEEAYHQAIKNPNYIFGIDDLNILVGNFVGNYNKLKTVSRIKFTKYHDALKASGLL